MSFGSSVGAYQMIETGSQGNKQPLKNEPVDNFEYIPLLMSVVYWLLPYPIRLIYRAATTNKNKIIS